MQDRIGFSFGNIFSASIPAILGVLGAFIANIPISIFGGNLPPPLLALMPVYFWCLVRPDLMPPWLAFGLGVLEDLLSGGPPGMWAAAFVASYILVDRQRDSFAGLAGFGAIIGFGAAMLTASVTAFAIAAFYYWRIPPVTMLIVQFALTTLFYIPAVAFLSFVHRRLVGPLRSDF